MNHEEAMKRLEKMQAMRTEGCTLEIIAQAFGISKQRVSALLKQGNNPHKRKLHKNRPHSVYVNLETWAVSHKCSWAELAEECGVHASLFYKNFVYGLSENPGKRSIDKLLHITGLSYEQLFERELTAS